jgi:hypothetical protein
LRELQRRSPLQRLQLLLAHPGHDHGHDLGHVPALGSHLVDLVLGRR